MNPTTRKTLMSSKRMTWRTPKHIVDAVTRFYGGKIGLDPCADRKYMIACSNIFDHGLDVPWAGDTYVNPPYGREIGKWTTKCATESCSHGNRIIALVPARTDTVWWHEAKFNAAILIRGRLTFVGAKHPAPFPSALLYWGRDPPGVADLFSSLGMLLCP